MFNNIGGKIKGLAEIVCGVGSVVCVAFGIMLVVDGAHVTGLLYALLGPLLCWIGCFTLYGFGHLIDNNDEMLEYARYAAKKNGYFDKLYGKTSSDDKAAEKSQESKVYYKDSKSYDEAFLREVEASPTSELLLIIRDQQDLYSERELALIKEELEKRNTGEAKRK